MNYYFSEDLFPYKLGNDDFGLSTGLVMLLRCMKDEYTRVDKKLARGNINKPLHALEFGIDLVS